MQSPFTAAGNIISHVDRFELAQADIDTLAAKFKYQGTDPIKTTARVLEQKVAKKRTNKKFLKNMATISLLFLTQGTNLFSMPKKSQDGSNIVYELIQNYSLKNGQVSPEELTLSCISLTFYAITVSTNKRVAKYLPVKPSFMATIRPAYPPGLMTQALAAAIPVDKPYTMTLVHPHCLHLIEFARVINPKMKYQSEAVILESCLPALRAALNKRDAGAHQRNVNFLVQVDVLTKPTKDQQEAPTEATSRAATVFRNRHGNVFII